VSGPCATRDARAWAGARETGPWDAGALAWAEVDVGPLRGVRLGREGSWAGLGKGECTMGFLLFYSIFLFLVLTQTQTK